jgi:hypothetical protein
MKGDGFEDFRKAFTCESFVFKGEPDAYVEITVGSGENFKMRNCNVVSMPSWAGIGEFWAEWVE